MLPSILPSHPGSPLFDDLFPSIDGHGIDDVLKTLDDTDDPDVNNNDDFLWALYHEDDSSQ